MTPVSWIPRQRTLEEDIAEEIARMEAPRIMEPPQWIAPIEEEAPPFEPMELPSWIPSRIAPQISPPPLLPVAKVPEVKEEKPIEVPFWQRGLQVFAAPFQWVEENIIKPPLALAATGLGFVEDAPRLPGEDFWEWKKRSWASWEAPGLDIKVPWSEESLRLDVRGVIEMAPWLLIPGAGQVGGGLKAARGIAGMLGKLGTTGRVLGTAVEYSPWGLVEKTAGVAIKGGFRMAGKVSERVSTAVGEKLFGKYVPPPMPPEVQKFGRYLKEVVKPARKAFVKEKPALRARQEALVKTAQERHLRGEISLEELTAAESRAMAGALKPEFALTPEALVARQARAVANVEARIASGELTEKGGRAVITKIKKDPAFVAVEFTKEEIDSLNKAILEGIESGLVKQDSGRAFRNMLLSEFRELPEPRHWKQWTKVFGPEFGKMIGVLKGSGKDISSFVDWMNIPRSMLASWDMSGTFRQGLILSLLHPTRAPIWFWRSFKSLLSEKLAFQLDDAMRARTSQLADDAGRPLAKIFESGRKPGYLAPLKDATFTQAEELFASRAARRIPGVRRSERAFSVYLNEARMDTFGKAYYAMKAQGATDDMLDMARDFINISSGRGTIPKSLERFSPFLNLALFSPRLQAATLQLPRMMGRMLLSKNPYMRKTAAQALITFVGGGASLLTLLNATGKGKVELDPRSGDFGKIKIGETRLDIWRGYLQYTRFMAQMLSGERKSAYGNMNKAERGEIAWRFIQSKASPAAGLMVDLLRGETYMGDKVFSDTTGFSKVVREKVLPLAIQDIIDAMEADGVNGMAIAAPALLGIGSLTIVSDLTKVQNKIANQLGYKSWDDIDPKTQREIQNRNAELQAAYINFDRQIMGTAWGDYRLAGNVIEDSFKQNVDLGVAQFRQSIEPDRGITFRKKVTDAFTARRGAYQARDKEERFADIVRRQQIPDTAQALLELGDEQLAIKLYNDALFGDDMYDQFGDYRFDEAELRKQQLRQQLGEELFNYVEDYRNLKFETLPPEFQELMRAKILLRPYWQIQDQVEKTFGKPKTVFQQRRNDRLIKRLKERMRRGWAITNPEALRLWTLFYTERAI